MRELTKSREKKLLGVAGGMAEYFEMDKSIWRAIWVFGCILIPPAILAYFILGIVLPESKAPVPPPPHWTPPDPSPAGGRAAESERAEPVTIDVKPAGAEQSQQEADPGPSAPPRATRRLTRSRDKMIAGVAAGLAEYFDIDTVLMRVLFVASIFLGPGILVYIILVFVMPNADRP